jgi:hypothetical protein
LGRAAAAGGLGVVAVRERPIAGSRRRISPIWSRSASIAEVEVVLRGPATNSPPTATTAEFAGVLLVELAAD